MERRFYHSLGALAVLSFTVSLAIAVVIWLWLVPAESPETPLEAVLVPFALSVPVFMVLVVGRRLQPVVVSDSTLRWKTDSGWHEVRWQAITSARSFGFLGIRYARLRSSDHKYHLWLPLFLAQRTDFQSCLAIAAGHDHCLSRLVADL
jgi:hypothetical protein